MRADPTIKNVLILALCQALGMSCSALIVTVVALVGSSLAPHAFLITLPLAVQFLAMMASAAPASFFMRRYGRRSGFTLGAGLGVAAGLIGAKAILEADFVLFCLASAIFGAFSAHVQFYRFAAADTASETFRSRAISLVLAGGVLSAFLGPELAKWSRELLAPVLFAGSYLCISGLALASMVLLQFIDIPRPSTAERRRAGRPLAEIMRQPTFIVAVACAMVGYGSMNLVMAATPLAMLDCRHPFDAAATVIQWHIVGMYAPSFFTGALIQRLGIQRVLSLGALAMIGCIAVNLSGQAVWQFWIALVLLGFGWNFLFVGGTTLLTSCYRPEERAKVQAANELLVFGTVAFTALLSGGLYGSLGWLAINLTIAGPLVLVLAAIVWHARKGVAEVTG